MKRKYGLLAEVIEAMDLVFGYEISDDIVKR